MKPPMLPPAVDKAQAAILAWIMADTHDAGEAACRTWCLLAAVFGEEQADAAFEAVIARTAPANEQETDDDDPS